MRFTISALSLIYYLYYLLASQKNNVYENSNFIKYKNRDKLGDGGPYVFKTKRNFTTKEGNILATQRNARRTCSRRQDPSPAPKSPPPDAPTHPSPSLADAARPKLVLAVDRTFMQAGGGP